MRIKQCLSVVWRVMLMTWCIHRSQLDSCLIVGSKLFGDVI
jgi:hypothetical protein